jgi:cardiolipin synthase
MVLKALQQAAQCGVQVYLLVDGYASQRLSRRFIQEIRSSGIHFRFFEPLFRSRYFYFGRRLHHKLLVVDARVAIAGGMNIADRYNDMPGVPAWLDYAVMLEGPVAQQLCVLCWKTWKSFPVRMGLTPCETNPPDFEARPGGGVAVRMRRNDWVRRKNEISASYVQMIRYAQKDIYILCSYFLPGKFIRRMLTEAVQRGVRIHIITAGRSDIGMAKHAERWLYDWLLRNKIRLYEYQPSILHAKLAVCDDEWLTAGSYNVNNISAYASIELNIDIADAELARQSRQMLDQIIQTQSIPITIEAHLRRKNPFIQLHRWFSYQIIRTIFYAVTFYYRRKQ